MTQYKDLNKFVSTKKQTKESIIRQSTLDKFFIGNSNSVQIKQEIEIEKPREEVITEFPIITDRITDIETLTKNNNLALDMINSGQIDNEKINELNVKYE